MVQQIKKPYGLGLGSKEGLTSEAGTPCQQRQAAQAVLPGKVETNKANSLKPYQSRQRVFKSFRRVFMSAAKIFPSQLLENVTKLTRRPKWAIRGSQQLKILNLINES
jgi:hypothetical protein